MLKKWPLDAKSVPPVGQPAGVGLKPTLQSFRRDHFKTREDALNLEEAQGFGLCCAHDLTGGIFPINPHSGLQ